MRFQLIDKKYAIKNKKSKKLQILITKNIKFIDKKVTALYTAFHIKILKYEKIYCKGSVTYDK